MFLCLTAHIWLLGQWNLQRPVGESLLLLGDTLLLLILTGLPIVFLIKGREMSSLFKRKSYFAAFTLYVALTILLSVLSFYGVIQILLPVIVIVIGVSVFLKVRSNKSIR